MTIFCQKLFLRNSETSLRRKQNSFNDYNLEIDFHPKFASNLTKTKDLDLDSGDHSKFMRTMKLKHQLEKI